MKKVFLFQIQFVAQNVEGNINLKAKFLFIMEFKKHKMGWATNHIQCLKDGKTITIQPKGNSMLPLVKSGEKNLVIPIKIEDTQVGDIVLCKVKGKEYFHLVAKVDIKRGCLITNAKGHENGWTRQVYGKRIVK
jgi:hypothetical protein